MKNYLNVHIPCRIYYQYLRAKPQRMLRTIGQMQ